MQGPTILRLYLQPIGSPTNIEITKFTLYDEIRF